MRRNVEKARKGNESGAENAGEEAEAWGGRA